MFDLFGKKAAQRYQAHKDALDAGRALLERYEPGHAPKWNETKRNQFALEFRQAFGDSLETVRCHIDTTMVPAQLGDADLLRELLEAVTTAQIISTGRVPAQGRQTMRAFKFTQIFKMLRKAVEETPAGPRFDPWCSYGEELTAHAAEALTWFKPGDRHEQLTVSVTDATKIYERAREALANRKT